MAPSLRDRISVDLRGLKPPLLARASAQGVSPSDLVRRILSEALYRPQLQELQMTAADSQRQVPQRGERSRLCLRMSAEEVAATLAAAHRAGMSPGRFVSGLVAGVPVLLAGGRRGDHLAALVASSAELSTLNRNIYHLSQLLRQGDVVPALAYRDTLSDMSGDVRAHLVLAAGVLSDLRPRRQSPPRALSSQG
jgi:plasmid stability protein